ncbi:MAG: CT_584 family protein [Chlamydiota bacterium]
MIEEQTLQQLEVIMKRIFTLPVTRTTFREIQSAFMGIAQGDKELFTDMVESLLAGQVKPTLKDKIDVDGYQEIIDEYCIQTRVSKEVHDRGQFISFITSDVLNQSNGIVLSNCLKTMEGEELRFATDIESSMQLIAHFIGRLHEAKNVEGSEKDFGRLEGTLENLRKGLDQL